jgi:hypothetical protein
MEVVFSAKVYSSKSRKGKDYYVYKVTIPKKVANQLGIKTDDYLLLKAMKAEWFHLLNWEQMEPTWTRLPDSIKERIRESGLPVPPSPIRIMPELKPQMSSWSIVEPRRFLRQDTGGIASVSDYVKVSELPAAATL